MSPHPVGDVIVYILESKVRVIWHPFSPWTLARWSANKKSLGKCLPTAYYFPPSFCPLLPTITPQWKQIKRKFLAKHNSSSLFFNKNNPSSQQHLPNHIKELAGPLSRKKFVGMTHKHKSLDRHCTLPWLSSSLGFCSGTFTPKVFNCMA